MATIRKEKLPSGGRRTTKRGTSARPSGGASFSLVPLKSGAQMEAVYTLHDKVESFTAGQTEEALAFLATSLRKLLDADNVKWLAAVRILPGPKAKHDALLGWRLRANYDLVPDPEEYRKLVAWWFARSGQVDPDFQVGLATHAMIAEAGRHRVHRLRDGWIPFREFSRSEHYRLHYTELGISDRIWVSFPLNADTESIFLIDRMANPRRFTKGEANLAGVFLRGLGGFHRRLFLSRGLLIGESTLSPAARRIVQKLLTGLSEKEIALSMNQSLATTHKYITTIYERFGVKGRAALMALWLGQ